MGGLLHSVDGGGTWETVKVTNWGAAGGGPMAIAFLDDLVGWITTDASEGYLYTSDGGKVWEPRPAPPGFNGSGPRPLVYTNQREAWAAADGAVYCSSDTGRTWTRVLAGGYDSVLFIKEKGVLMAVGKDIATKELGN